ncbi:hypothetical protein CN981_08825 [Priestia megaterium]|nr:hypothetical protein CN981_08825 [Priestia megaterium]
MLHDLEELAKLAEMHPNGSLLNPDRITFCKDCRHSEQGELKACTECKSTDVEIIEVSKHVHL